MREDVEEIRTRGGRMRRRMNSETFDHIIVGGGLVGLATARALLLHSEGSKIVLIEKEQEVAMHQSGRNSGVLHAGVYYAPGTARARLCREGRAAMIEYCREHAIAMRICGKVIVAVDAEETARLDALEARARANGVAVERLGRERLKELEPAANGVAALHVPETGVVDFRAVAKTLASELLERGVEIWLGESFVGARVDRDRLRVFTTTKTAVTRSVITCAGLHADRVSRAALAIPRVSIVPFRGEYSAIRSSRDSLVRALIYPVPDPRLPFLGVHFTRDVHGVVECGPNAVLAFAREGYHRTIVDLRDLWSTLTTPGFLKFARTHARHGVAEFRRSFDKTAFANAGRRLIPDLRDDDLEPALAGVRAQAITPEGTLVDDFEITESRFGLHVLNAPSPAATASLAIGRELAQRAHARGTR